jgi:non-ribosomal peptide synthetase component E (peptide arylation enzyme)
MGSIAAAAVAVVEVVAGVDTHLDVHHAAVISLSGELLGTRSFATTRAGYRAMLAWFRSYGEVSGSAWSRPEPMAPGSRAISRSPGSRCSR